MRLLLFVVVFIMSGCAGKAPLSGAALVPQDQAINADHLVTFKSGERRENFRTHLDIQYDEVVLVGMGILGQTLFECQSRAKDLQCSKISSLLPAERLFADIQTMIWTANEEKRFTSVLTYEDKIAGYHITLKPLNLERGYIE